MNWSRDISATFAMLRIHLSDIRVQREIGFGFEVVFSLLFCVPCNDIGVSGCDGPAPSWAVLSCNTSVSMAYIEAKPGMLYDIKRCYRHTYDPFRCQCLRLSSESASAALQAMRAIVAAPP